MTPLRSFLVLAYQSLLCTVPAWGQSPTWISHWDSENALPLQVGFKMAVAADGSVYCGGGQGTLGFDMDGNELFVLGYSDIVIAKLDDEGLTQWAITAGGDCSPFDSESASQVSLNESEDALYCSGWYQSFALFGDSFLYGGCTNELDLFIARYDTAGTFEWARGIRGYEVLPQKFLLDGADNVWLFGFSRVGSAVLQDNPQISTPEGAFLARYNSAGSIIGVEHIMGSGRVEDAEWLGTDILVGGSYGPQDSLWHTHLDAGQAESCGFVGIVGIDGSPVWLVELVSDSLAVVKQVAVAPNGDVVIAGVFRDSLQVVANTIHSNTPGESVGFLARFDADGSLQWAIPMTGSGFETIGDLQVDADDVAYVQGRIDGEMVIADVELTPRESRGMYLLKMSTAGECTAALLMGRVGLSGSGSVVPQDNALYVSWTYDSTMVVGDIIVEPGNIGVSDFFVAKFDSLSGYTAISALPLNEDGLLIFANPNNGLCTIDLPEHLRVTDDLMLSVFDRTGHLVQRVPMRYTNEGVALDIRAQAKGIYHVELGDGRQRYTGTIVFE